MYLDSVVIFSLVVVILTCTVVIYVGIYAWRHIKSDVDIDSQTSQKDTGKNQNQSDSMGI